VPHEEVRRSQTKVPEVTILFWVVKLLSTAMGESTSDYLVFHIDPYIAVMLGCVGLAVSLAAQLVLRRYVVWVYWLTVVMVAIFGTMAADVLHVVFLVPYWLSTGAFSVVLAIVFAVWQIKEGTIAIHTVDFGRRELFYWATVMATFALGTAAGDLTAAGMGLGYFASIGLFALLFALPFFARRFFRLDDTFAFWFAYVVTRPLGASVADSLGKTNLDGLGLGDGRVSIVLTLLISGFVLFLATSREENRRPAPLGGQ